LSRRTTAEQTRARREKAVAAGLCVSCCCNTPRPGFRVCDRCRDTGRRYRLKSHGKPHTCTRLPALPVAETFDVEADRREEWLALNELSITCYVGRLPWVHL
jgi:hypothetical protein